MDNGQAIGMVK